MYRKRQKYHILSRSDRRRVFPGELTLSWYNYVKSLKKK